MCTGEHLRAFGITEVMRWKRGHPRLFMALCLFGGLVVVAYLVVIPRQTPSETRVMGNVKYMSHNEALQGHKKYPISPAQFHKLAPTRKPEFYIQKDQGCYTATNYSGIYQKFDCNSTSVTSKETIAIGCAVTTHDMKLSEFESIGQTLTFMRTLLPSVCRTVSKNFKYIFYIAYDQYDALFSRDDGVKLFQDSYEDIKGTLCPAWADVQLRLVKCSHTGNPAWAQNDAMMEAYLENATYYFRVNDDTSLRSPGWTEKYIEVLKSYDPPNIGVVGPAHIGGNEYILTHDFVHRMHIDIFGFYYPRTFRNWWADNWITLVYEPGRMTKVEGFEAVHTWERGTRYNHTKAESMDFLYQRVQQDKKTLIRYVNFVKSGKVTPSKKKIISMSLYNSDIKYTYGAIRNALLRPLIFPEWTLRIYVERPGPNGKSRYPPVPMDVLSKLKDLGVQLYYVDWNDVNVPPMMWRFLVADDETIDWFIVRDADSRLTHRDAMLVQEWMVDGAPLYCVRDHPSQVSDPLFGGLWGGRPKEMRTITKAPLTMLMRGAREDYGQDIYILSYILWPRIRDFAYCHDSISCHRYFNSHGVNITRNDYQHVGQVFDAYGQPREIDIDILKHTNPADFCIDKPREEVSKYRSDDEQLTFEEVEDYIVSPFKFKNVLIWTINYDNRAVLDVRYAVEAMGAKFLDFNFDENCALTNNCATELKSVGTAEDFFGLSSGFIKDFSSYIQKRPDFKNITHFLCVHPVSLCELYLEFSKPPFNKSVIIIAKDRYEWGRENGVRWQQLNRNLLRLSWEPRHIVAANNHYDLEYMRHFLGSGMPLIYLPSQCGYVNASYKAKRDGFLVMPVASSSKFEKWFVKSLNETMMKNRIKIHFHLSSTVYGKNASHQDLASHPGIIHIPEQVSMATICEYYQMNIPIFIPSLGLLAKWQMEWNILKQRTLNSLRNTTGSPIEGVSRTADPNDEASLQATKALQYWLRFADIYQWPYLLPYDSIDHLIYLLTNGKLNITSRKMNVFNKKLRRQVTEKWVGILEKTLRYSKS